MSNSVFRINSVNQKGPDLKAAEGSGIGGLVWLMLALLAICLTFWWAYVRVTGSSVEIRSWGITPVLFL